MVLIRMLSLEQNPDLNVFKKELGETRDSDYCIQCSFKEFCYKGKGRKGAIATEESGVKERFLVKRNNSM